MGHYVVGDSAAILRTGRCRVNWPANGRIPLRVTHVSTLPHLLRTVNTYKRKAFG